MSEPSPRSPIATSPISVILFARAFDTDTQDGLTGWNAFLATLQRPYEILVIQEVRPEAPAANASASFVRTITYERDLGFRDAVNEAIRAAQYPLIAFCTCDGQFVPAELDRLLKKIDSVDLVIGYRAGGQAPPWRVLLDMFLGIVSRVLLGIALEPRATWLGSEGRGRRWVARWIFGLRVTDPECPFRLARRAIFDRIPIQSRGPFVHVEFLAKANHLTCYLAEEPVSWNPPANSPSDAISFGADARLVFRDPDFGPASIVQIASAAPS